MGNDDFDPGSLPLFNYNIPYGAGTPSPGFPTLGSTIYPYSYLNSYINSPFWALPPLPAPALIIGGRLPHVPLGTHWPASGLWSSTHHPSPGINSTWLATHRPGIYQHPIQYPTTFSHTGAGVMPHSAYTHPAYAHPVVPAPHVGAAPSAVHVGHR